VAWLNYMPGPGAVPTPRGATAKVLNRGVPGPGRADAPTGLSITDVTRENQLKCGITKSVDVALNHHTHHIHIAPRCTTQLTTQSHHTLALPAGDY